MNMFLIYGLLSAFCFGFSFKYRFEWKGFSLVFSGAVFLICALIELVK